MTREKALEIGGKEWKGGANHRVYFNQDALVTLYGLEGINVVNGRPRKWLKDGDAISNSKVSTLFAKRSYYDVVSDKLVDVDTAMVAI